MRYMLLIYNDEAAMASAPTEKTYEISAAYGAYTEALKKSGAWLAGDRLKPTQSATSVRMANGKTNVLDGPYADTKEQLAGFYMIEATDIDTAIEWAARCPAASTGTVEVRPIWEMTEYISEK
ncbi:YciI family protein [Mesorhizobium sp.]|uniref:YciI family protein n=1 Tax=Mesorhizobium sp. TaxID=1871066 RepID=UPI00122BE6BB|nr:YciI family protein [Mesorhizobium sp.]TIS59993.1 MAG: YciI family protein [Mesorhizobium sp.]TIS89608.1 MAG: YciI family protein [Mesorhizobium sp.]